MSSLTPTRSNAVAAARRLKGVPFRHQGRSPQGIDCVGLLILVADELGLPYYDEPNYARHTRGNTFIQKFREGGVTIKNLKDRAAGDIIVIRQRQRPCHVAVYSGENTIIHSYASRGKVVEEPYTKYWIGDTVGCYTWDFD